MCPITEAMDMFAHPFWDTVRYRAARKAMEIRRQGFSGAAMLPYSELEYGRITRILDKIDRRFSIRSAERANELVAV